MCCNSKLSYDFLRESVFSKIKELQPLKTNIKPQIKKFEGVKAILFDIYGTLIISDSGDIGNTVLPGQNAVEAFNELGITLLRDSYNDQPVGDFIVECFRAEIDRSHKISKTDGVLFPEVLIQNIWNATLNVLKEFRIIEQYKIVDTRELAVIFECLNNLTYPMPDLASVLSSLHEGELKLGIISNAQFFTPILLSHFLNESNNGELSSFERNLCFYSYEYGEAKPGTSLYDRAVQVLGSCGIKPSETLYIGNDMLNDIYPAKKVGFKTVLYAGDKRSLRLRNDNKEIKLIRADALITELSQIEQLID